MLRLPVAAITVDAPPREDGGAGADVTLGARRVLVVEDNADAAQMVVGLIQRWGPTRSAMRLGATPRSLAAAFDPHVVLVDVGLPGMDGYRGRAPDPGRAWARARCSLA